MCRLLVFKGSEPIPLSHLITEPAHSIINQAFDSRLRLEGPPINADGFGIGWYDRLSVPPNNDGIPKDDEEGPNKPCLFKAITPAWSNKNLHRLASKLHSPLIFAHVRASTSGVLSEENCHPWTYNSLLFMHNGSVAEFGKIKRALQSRVNDEVFEIVEGNTDSEWVFALFLQHLSELAPLQLPSYPHSTLKRSILSTIETLNDLSKQAGITEPSLLNICVTDGSTVVATRYISSRNQDAASLYFSTGSSFIPSNTTTSSTTSTPSKSLEFRMLKSDKRESVFLLASEPLTFQREDWIEIKTNTCVVITDKMNLLQFPIVDEFYAGDEGRGGVERKDSFVRSKGLQVRV